MSVSWLTDPLAYGFTLRALAELAILGAAGGAIGCWIVLYRISYAAESLAHGMLPGLVAASLLGIPLLAGGAAGVIAAGLLIVLAGRFVPGETDTAIAVVVTALFGLGVLMALSPASPAGIQALLFGNPLGVGDGDLLATALAGGAVLFVLWRGHDRLLAIGFGQGGGDTSVSPTPVRALLLVLVAVTVLIGALGLGTLLVAAILVGPAAAARLVSDRIVVMIAISIAFAVAAGFAGIYLSYHLGIAAGPAVVICVLALYPAAALTAAIRRRVVRADPTGPRPGLPAGEAAS